MAGTENPYGGYQPEAISSQVNTVAPLPAYGFQGYGPQQYDEGTFAGQIRRRLAEYAADRGSEQVAALKDWISRRIKSNTPQADMTVGDAIGDQLQGPAGGMGPTPGMRDDMFAQPIYSSPNAYKPDSVGWATERSIPQQRPAEQAPGMRSDPFAAPGYRSPYSPPRDAIGWATETPVPQQQSAPPGTVVPSIPSPAAGGPPPPQGPIGGLFNSPIRQSAMGHVQSSPMGPMGPGGPEKALGAPDTSAFLRPMTQPSMGTGQVGAAAMNPATSGAAAMMPAAAPAAAPAGLGVAPMAASGASGAATGAAAAGGATAASGAAATGAGAVGMGAMAGPVGALAGLGMAIFMANEKQKGQTGEGFF